MAALTTVRAVEETSLNAWPAHQTLTHRGWLLRFAEGYTRRSNSVNPIYFVDSNPNDAALSQHVVHCEQIYRQQEQPTIFKITPIARPKRLDGFLDQQGYTREASTAVCIRPLIGLPPLPPDRRVEIESSLSPAWLDRFVAYSQQAQQKVPAMRSILQNIVLERAFFTLYSEDEPVACGLAVLQGNLVGVFDIVTDPRARGQGNGTALLYHLLHWGADAGASVAYLQVMYNNKAARQLYQKLGFEDLYVYWYRVNPAQ